jgi:osmotically inducible protein OsmC
MSTYGTAKWQGGLKDGIGALSTKSGVLREAPYGFKARFEGGPGTNPEELLGAAHAGCFTMALSAILGEAGMTAEQMDTKCDSTTAPPRPRRAARSPSCSRGRRSRWTHL